MALPEDDNRISITICGDGGCGKSSITLRLVRSQWTEDYDPTIEDSYSTTRTIAGRTYNLSLTDTAGQEEYRSLFSSSALHTSDAFLLVYDITSPSSLANLDYFATMIELETEHRLDVAGGGGNSSGNSKAARQRSPLPPPVKLVVGNKCDLSAQGRRQVGSQEGWAWARSRGCGFMECSAREMVNIEETFALLVRRVVEARQAAAASSMSSRNNNKQQLFSNHKSPTKNKPPPSSFFPQPVSASRTQPLPPPSLRLPPSSLKPSDTSLSAFQHGEKRNGNGNSNSKDMIPNHNHNHNHSYSSFDDTNEEKRMKRRRWGVWRWLKCW